MGAVRYCLVVVAGLHNVAAPSTACVQPDLPLCNAYDFYCCECSVGDSTVCRFVPEDATHEPCAKRKLLVCVPVIASAVENLRILQRIHESSIQGLQSKPFCGAHACRLRFAFCR